MSYEGSSNSQPPPVPPHIRLNSDAGEISSDNSAPSRSLTRPSTNPFASGHATESADRLLPPQQDRPRRYRDDDLPSPMSRSASAFSSRRSSWESEHSRDSRGFDNPFRDTGSRPESRADSDEEHLNTQTVSEKYNILPSAGLLLYPEDIEKDDYLHNPSPDDNDRDCDIFTKRGIVNVGGLTLITMGILFLFIGYPAMTFIQRFTTNPDPCAKSPNCLNVGKIPLLKNVRTGPIDPDTPKSAMSKKDHHGNTWNLVFSDEFNTPGRTFYDGDDPYFQAVDLWYGVTQDLEWYDPDAVTTEDGVLSLRFDAFQNHNLNYRSGMVQTWNKLCFKGGRLEASISLPGRGDTVGFWPGFWTLGNLGRPGYASTTDGMWPYSYSDVCDAGITPNQSSADGISYLPGMRLPSCTCSGEDHPSPGKSRSAPEIDVIEATNADFDGKGNVVGHSSQSFQVAPFDIWYYPNYDFVEVFDYSITQVNNYRGGPFQQAVSALTNLNNDWYDGNAYQVYSFEYTPGADGDVTWFIGDAPSWRVTGQSLGPNGNVAQRVLPEEPMSIIMNFGMSSSFSAVNFTGLAPLLPAKMRFDYIRIYQDGDMELTCDPDGYPTTDYINRHKQAYHNPNVTHWDDAGFTRPKNSLMDGC